MVKNEFEEFCNEIDIPYLVHFTHISNLDGILKNGLISRDTVDLSEGIKINDEDRYDERTNTISLSISHPNDLMFYKYRDNDEDWCVIALNSKILSDLDCLFCKHNAADARIRSLDDDELATIDSFTSMFDEIASVESREDQHLKAYDPTDKQAEILVFDHIPTKYILGVFLSNHSIKKKLQGILGDTKVVINSPDKGVYATRLYRRKWQ